MRSAGIAAALLAALVVMGAAISDAPRAQPGGDLTLVGDCGGSRPADLECVEEFPLHPPGSEPGDVVMYAVSASPPPPLHEAELRGWTAYGP